METTTEATALVAAANRRNGTRHEVRCVGKRQIAAIRNFGVSRSTAGFQFCRCRRCAAEGAYRVRFALLPAVVGTSGNTGQWDRPGSVRTVHLADVTTAREEVTDYESGRYFAYRTSDYTFALRHLAAFAEGQWWFKPDANGTAVRWTYTFQAKNWLTSILLRLFVRTQWVGYMRTCIVHVQGHCAR